VAEISAEQVKTLRERTGAGMMDCKRVLADANGDMERAAELLRERGLAKAVKREGRATSEGAIAIAFAAGAGGMVEVGCETDFVARTDEFQRLAASLAGAVAGDAGVDGPEALLAARVDGETVSERIRGAIAKLGENVVLKRVARLAADGGGVVGGYVHAGGKLGVLVALSTAARGAEIEGLARDVAMHVAAADPSPVAVERSQLSPKLLESERAIYRAQAEQEGKPAKVIDRIVDGKLNKFAADVCLVEQAFVKDPDRSVGDVVGDAAKRAGASIQVVGFRRFKLGEAAGA
jgi:elongation factor Ts